eukprot:TRINITY_DN66415_c0_g1_i1.p2 TRINITY_DN66415_c0_g1~~TRINITY_DN66415_c0_g1_i1.p2  ORF type:complete len:197 (+),score=44.68 TRINITY_DN66415_c0_g1_i1:89-679(+)
MAAGGRSPSPQGADEPAPVSAEVSATDPAEFHKEWMERVHRRVIQTVHPGLAKAVEDMPQERVTGLYYPPADVFGKPVPLSQDTQDFPVALSLWYPSAHTASTMTWRLGGIRNHGTRGIVSHRHHRTGNWGPMDHVSFHEFLAPKGFGKPRPGRPLSPWRLPARYKTIPIPLMHIQGPFGLCGLRCMSPFGLRLLL